MDNGLRGGIPLILGDIDDRTSMRSSDEDARLKVYYVFSRQHGDLERDYNKFALDPTYFSQGPGNYRDVLQNRRHSVQFHPRVGSHDVHTFLSYIQADGHNPLRVEAAVFVLRDEQQCDRLATMAVGSAVGHLAQRDALHHILCNGPFRPGQLFLLIEEQSIELIMDRQHFIDEVVSVSHTYPMAVFGDGYWADHWTYYLDLVDSFLAIYPEKEYELLYDKKLNYFYSACSIKPRSEKYVLSYTVDGWGRHVRQLNATVTPDMDKFKSQMNYRQASTGWFGINANWQHDTYGFLFTSTPMAKLFLLASLKFATRDAYGMGIEYESGKPGWNDAMNGLTGMVGSGMPETYELKRLVTYLLKATQRHKQSIVVPLELNELLTEMDAALATLRDSKSTKLHNLMKEDDEEGDILRDVPEPFFKYWDRVASARETYRRDTRLTFSGATHTLEVTYLVSTLQKWLEEMESGIDRAFRVGSHGVGNNGTTGITPTYFSYDVTRWALTSSITSTNLPLVNATSMRVKTFALFLEGPVRQMHTLDTQHETLEVYRKVKASGLRDQKLKMYTVSDSLQGQSVDLGRAMAFSPGWLENRSVWLQMSYKYYLALLRNKLYEQFFDEMLNGGMLPFMDSTKYGRSLLECSSFVVSSAFADESQHGRGFLARLSGATSEFLSMWLLMFVGPAPFYVDEDSGELAMQLVPSLPLWLFQDSHSSGVPPPPYDQEKDANTSNHNSTTSTTTGSTINSRRDDNMVFGGLKGGGGGGGALIGSLGGGKTTNTNNNNNSNSIKNTRKNNNNNKHNSKNNDNHTPLPLPTVKFTLFGTIHVTYHNLVQTDLFETHPSKYVVWYKDGTHIAIDAPTIKGDVAKKIRGQLLVDSIHAYFGTD
jgi:hypothetical protein